MVPGWNHEEADTTFTLRAIDFIKRRVKTEPDKPFFVYLPLSLPHKPWLPPNFVQGETGAGARGDQVYLADWCLGKILATLDELDISENTLVIFTSDNGPREGVNGHSSAAELRGLKGSVYEGGHRVPFVARWPERIRPGQVSDQTICLTDLLATCVAIIGEDLPDDAGPDSYNILPALLGESLDAPIREATIHHSGGGQFAIRQGEWKLIEAWQRRGRGRREPDHAPKSELYNLVKDPAETTDVYADHPEVAEHLVALLQKFKTEGRSRP